MRWVLDGLGLARSVLFTLPLIYLITLALSLVWFVILPFDRGGELQHRLCRFWARSLLRVSLVRVQVRGAENLEPGRHYVYVANHQSYADIPVLFGYLPATFRIMAKASLFYIPIIGWYLRWNGHLPVTWKNPVADARRLLQAIKYIREERSVVVFPEGGRSLSGQLGEFKTGIFLAAIKGAAPVVPVTIVGSRHLLARRSWHIRPGRIELIIEPPVRTEGLGRDQLNLLVEQVRRPMERNLRGDSQ